MTDAPSEDRPHHLIQFADRLGLSAFAVAGIVWCGFAVSGGLPIIALSYLQDIPAQELVRPAVTMLINVIAIAYMCGMAVFSVRQLQRDLRQLDFYFERDPVGFDAVCRAPAIDRHPKTHIRITIAGFLFGAIMFAVGRIYENVVRDGLPPGYEVWPIIIIPALWAAIAYTAWIISDNARYIGRVARTLPNIDLLNNERMIIFTRITTLQILFVLGALAVLPLQVIIIGNLEADDIIPSSVVSTLLIGYGILHPLGDARARIRQVKSAELERVAAALRAIPSEARMTHGDVPRLLAYREAVEKVDEWPLSGSTLFRLILFVFIPPVTWTLAAIISVYVEGFFATL